MATPIKVIPTLHGKEARDFLKKANAAEQRYYQLKAAGKLKV